MARHWEEEVGSLAVGTEDGLVLIDPLEPPADLARPVHVLDTVYWHARATADLKASTWAPSRSLRPLANRGVEATDAANGLPGGIRAFPTARAAEAVYWLPEQRAVAVGDVRLGAGAWLDRLLPNITSEPLRMATLLRGHRAAGPAQQAVIGEATARNR